MSFPSDNHNSLALIVVNDGYGLKSTLYDASHLSLLTHLLGFKRVVTISNDSQVSVTGQLVISSDLSCIHEYFTGEYQDILVVLSMDIAIGRQWEQLLNQTFQKLTQSVQPSLICGQPQKVTGRLLVLLDMCESGQYLHLPFTYPSIYNKVVETGIVAMSSVSQTEFDQDDVSELGFGGGLSDVFINYLLGPTNLEPKEVLTDLQSGSFRPLNTKISCMELFKFLNDHAVTHPTMRSNVDGGWLAFG